MARPQNLLFRSHIEILRIMHMLSRERSPVAAEFPDGRRFFSRLLPADPHVPRFYVAYSESKALNALLLAAPSIEFTATDPQNLHFTFAATAPEETLLDGEPAIQFAMPKVLMLHNQREQARLPVPTELSLRCVADEAGFIPFESHVTDISHDGLGCLVYDPDINLEKGTILRGCRIVIPNGDAVIADLELRHINKIALPDGTFAHRAGFRFADKTSEQKKLIDIFIQDLDKKAG